MAGEVLFELKPMGISITGADSKPLLLLRDDSGEMSMPLPITQLEAQILMNLTGKGITLANPYAATEHLLKWAGLKVNRCEFYLESSSSPLMARLCFAAPSEEGVSLLPLNSEPVCLLKAEMVVALCLQLNVPMYASRDVIWSARKHSVDLQESQDPLSIFQGAAFRPHHYLM